MPQSICTRYGLAVGYYTSWLVRVLMVISYPIAWPLGRLLDKILGHGDATLPRGQLQHYVTLHGEAEGFAPLGQGLTDNELHVINSALELTYKRAKAAMTPLDTVFMVSSDDVLNEALVARILATGHSRVPVFSGRDRSNVVGLLLVKELLLKVTVRSSVLLLCVCMRRAGARVAEVCTGRRVQESVRVGDLPMRSMPSLSASMPMYDVLHLFKIGRAHMALLREASPGAPLSPLLCRCARDMAACECVRGAVQSRWRRGGRRSRRRTLPPPACSTSHPPPLTTTPMCPFSALSGACPRRKDPVLVTPITPVARAARVCRRASAEAAGIAAEDVSEMYINVTEGTVVGIITIEDVIEVRRPTSLLVLALSLLMHTRQRSGWSG